MTKQQLLDSGFKYITTQNCEQETEVWAKFSGYEDTIQYCYYFPLLDMTVPTIQTISYVSQLDMFAQMRDKLRNDFLKEDIHYDKNCIWFDKTKI